MEIEHEMLLHFCSTLTFDLLLLRLGEHICSIDMGPRNSMITLATEIFVVKYFLCLLVEADYFHMTAL